MPFCGLLQAAVAAHQEARRLDPLISTSVFGMLYLISLRAMLEGQREKSLQASKELMRATFRDPEGMYYLARQLSYLGQEAQALEMISRAIGQGFLCYPAMVRDPWLDALRGNPGFTALLGKAHQLYREAAALFVRRFSIGDKRRRLLIKGRCPSTLS